MKLKTILFLFVASICAAGCIFDDIEDPETAGAVFALVALCLVLYCAKCLFQSVSKQDEESTIDKLTEIQ